MDDTARSVANDGPGGSRDVSDRRLRGNALSRQSAGQIREELLFAAEEMRYPGNIDPESLGRVERHHGRIADRPARQLPQRGLVLVRHRLNNMQIRNECLRLRERHANMQTEVLSSRTGCA